MCGDAHMFFTFLIFLPPTYTLIWLQFTNFIASVFYFLNFVSLFELVLIYGFLYIFTKLENINLKGDALQNVMVCIFYLRVDLTFRKLYTKLMTLCTVE